MGNYIGTKAGGSNLESRANEIYNLVERLRDELGSLNRAMTLVFNDADIGNGNAANLDAFYGKDAGWAVRLYAISQLQDDFDAFLNNQAVSTADRLSVIDWFST